jgi:hypothetical protein
MGEELVDGVVGFAGSPTNAIAEYAVAAGREAA